MRIIINTLFVLLCTPLSIGMANDVSPRFVVHLLDYLSQDYGEAIKDGQVINQYEYEEQIEFINASLAASQKIDSLVEHDTIVSDLQALKQDILNKASVSHVSQFARKIQKDVIKTASIAVAPLTWPNRNTGKNLFKTNCTSCHGTKGGGDGPLASGLNPRPTNFLDKEYMNGVSAFKSFNTIRLGIPETSMAPHNDLTDQQVWDIAFYLLSLRYDGFQNKALPPSVTLKQVASMSDNALYEILEGSKKERLQTIKSIRLHIPTNIYENSLLKARAYLNQAVSLYETGDQKEARKKALLAYLEGIEPIEPKLKANDPSKVIEIEMVMADVRQAIEKQKSLDNVRQATEKAHKTINEIESFLESQNLSPWMTFLITIGILLREALEALLVIVVLLGVVRAYGSKAAMKWIHGGWISALGLGLLAWFFSGWIMNMSGASRELLEGFTSLLAVLILLYVGIWLHQQSNIARWHLFLKSKVHAFTEGKNRFGLAFIAFIAVFREAFEVVLFLRALWVGGQGATHASISLGVLSSAILVIILAYVLLKYSARLPLRQLFSVSAALLIVLAFMLSGKGLHSLQEAGWVSITSFSLPFHGEILGIYPTVETFALQLLVFIGCVGFFWYDRKAHR